MERDTLRRCWRRWLLACTAVVAMASCDDGPAPSRPVSLAIVPSSVTFASLGDTAVVTASMTDQYGAAFAGAVRWSSSRPAVFTVTDGGVVEAVASGSGMLTASFQDLSATAEVTVAQEPATVSVVSGAEQAVRQGLALPADVVVRTDDAGGSPIEGVTVVFAPAEGDGTAAPATAATDAEGRAATSWTLGDRAGAQSLVASVAGGGGPSVQLSATALTPEEATDSLQVVQGDGQTGLQGRALREAVVVLALDGRGEPVPGVRVAFAPADGDGAAGSDTVATDAEGRAATSWTLGDRAGEQSLVASVASGGGPSAQLSATALTPEEATDSLRVVQGDGQTGLQGRALREAVVVLALDGPGEPVPGVRVVFVAARGDGAAGSDTVATDAEGRAGTSWTLGDRAGAQRLVASVAVAGGPSVQLSATALTPEEATDSLRVVQGDGQSGVREATLPVPVVFAALDADGQPVPGVEVSFAPNRRNGRADPRSATTDARGRAQTSWTLGASLGTQVLTATAGGVSVQATATALTPEEAADSLRVVEGDGQRGVREATLPAPVVVVLLGTDGQPVPGVEVSFAPNRRSGRAAPRSATTDALGRAQTSWTLGASLGRQVLAATAADVSTRATATATTPEEAADSLRVVEGGGQRGVPEATLPAPVVFAVLDANGRGVPGVEVSFSPNRWHGRADPRSATTDARGRARTFWTLGTSLGTQVLTATAAEVSTRATATATTPEEAADSLRVVEGDGQRGRPGAPLSAPVVFAVLDAAGQPVLGVKVAFSTAAGNGRADPRSATTDARGRAQTSWTLGAPLGAQALTATAAGLSAQATATALVPEDHAADIRVVSGNGQRGVQGATLPARVVFAVLDTAGRGVPDIEVAFSTAAGNGRADPGSATTDARGRAQTSWTLGAPLGAQALTATAAGLSVQATAEATDAPSLPTVRVAAAYLVQAAQDSAGSVPLIAGRPARLRVFAVGDGSPTARFRPLALFYRGSTVVDSVRLDSGAVSATMDEGAEDESFDATIPGSLVKPGLKMVVELDPDDEVAVADGSVTRFPATGRAGVLVQELPSFPLTLVPFHFATPGNTGANAAITAQAQDMAGADTEGIISYTRNVLPIGDISVTARQPFVSGADTAVGLYTVLGELGVVRHADGSSEHYHALVAEYRRVRGISYGVSGQAGFPWYIAATTTHHVDGSAFSADSVAKVFAHELGHLISLEHAPCGRPSGLDPDFPYSDGSIGTYGYSFSDTFVSGLVKPAMPDVMGYCSPSVWISDYHFKKAMDYRRSLASRAGRAPVASGKTLLLWGSVEDGGEMRLEPAFASDGPVKLPESAGPYRLEGLAANGESLFRLAFSPDPVVHGGGGTFVFALPFEEAWTGALDRIELTGPEGATAVDRAVGERAAMLIDRATGQVRSIVRNWSGALPAAFGAPNTVVIRRGLPR